MIYLPAALIAGIFADLLLMRQLRLTKYPFTAALSLIEITILSSAFDNHLTIIKGFLFAQILIFTGFHDAKTKEIPNIVHVLIILTALISIKPIDSITGLIIVPMPYLLVAMTKECGIGGGDIKLMGACGFLLGVAGGIFASVMGLAIAVCFNLSKRSDKSESFPLAPYLATGCFVAYLLFQ